jgi:hypothetical protein
MVLRAKRACFPASCLRGEAGLPWLGRPGQTVRDEPSSRPAGSPARGQQPDARLTVRQTQSTPLFAEPRTWLDKSYARIPAKSELAGAIRYTLTRWQALTLVLRDGRACLDNNAAERSMRPMCLGRKNWLFAPCLRRGRLIGYWWRTRRRDLLADRDGEAECARSRGLPASGAGAYR